MKLATCQTCKHVVLDSEGRLQCRRSPPRPVVIAKPNPAGSALGPVYEQLSLWPHVERNDACGEHTANVELAS